MMNHVQYVRCTDCRHNRPRKMCKVNHAVYCSAHWRHCDVYQPKASIQPLRRRQPKTPESVRAELESWGLGVFVLDVIDYQGNIAIRLVKGTPDHVKRVVDSVMRS